MMQTKQEAMDQVEKHANIDWRVTAHGIVIALALTHPEFTTDEVWYRLSKRGVKTHEPRAMGAVMRKAARDGLIERTDRVIPSSMPQNHQRPVTIWRSKVRIGGDL